MNPIVLHEFKSTDINFRPITQLIEYCFNIRSQSTVNKFSNLIRNMLIMRVRQSTSDTGLCIRVAAQRNQVPDSIFKIILLKKCYDCLGHRTLTGYVKSVVWPDLFQFLTEVVIKPCFQLFTDFILLQSFLPSSTPSAIASAP